MKRKNVGTGRKFEEEIAALFGMQAVPQSGANWQKGLEDITDDDRLGQIKTGEQKVTVDYQDAWKLCDHADGAGKKHKIFIMVFEEPTVRTTQGSVTIGRQVWVCLPYEAYNEMYNKQ